MSTIDLPNLASSSNSVLGLDKYSLQMSFMSYFRTGYPIVDQILVTFVVGCILNIFTYLKPEQLKPYLSTLYNMICSNKEIELNTVEITSKTQLVVRSGQPNFEYNDQFYEKNNYLIQALYDFLNQHIENLKTSEINISFKSGDQLFQTFRNFSTGFRPKEQIKIGDFFITIELSESTKDTNSADDKKTVNLLRSVKFIISSHLSTEKIHDFIISIWKAYVEKNYPVDSSLIKNPKYYLIRSTDNNDKCHYIRYPLISKITFDDVIFPDKERLIRRIKQFMDGQTKLSRFSILLHGNPGGGKTSFIKSLQNFTDCHVIVIKLSQFHTLDELIDVFHKERLLVSNGLKSESESLWAITIPIKQRIYLLEDIDAEDEIVLSRTSKSSSDSDSDSDSDSNSDSDSDGDNDDKDDDDIPMLLPIKYNVEANATKANATKANATNSNDSKTNATKANANKANATKANASKSNDSKLTKAESNKLIITKALKACYKKSKYSSYKAIKLADILNLLDGVLELNGCFVVMTTNHPEKLDPALIREGRITYSVELGEIIYSDMQKMIHKFLPSEYDPVVGHPIIDHKLKQLPKMMPCKFEQLVQHEINLSGVIENLDKILNQVSNSGNSGNPENSGISSEISNSSDSDETNF